jgi:PhnB protein
VKYATPFLAFDGNCREAMTFYAKCLDAALFLLPYRDAPFDAPKQAGERILHSTLNKAGQVLLMADDVMPGSAFQPGNNFSVFLECESREEIETVFAALAEKGQITMPLQDTFWNARFGTLTDQFGVKWSFNWSFPG